MFGASAASPWSRFLNRAVSSSSFSVHQTPETLATVAAGCSVLVNTSCRLVNLTAHLRQKAGLPPDASLHVLPATIALLAEDGNLVSLEQDLKEGAAQTQTMGNSLLKERAIYVLVRTISKRERTWSPSAMSPYWRTWMTITQSWQVQTDSNPARLLLRNLELLRSCISNRGKVRQDLRLLGAPKLWVQRMGCGGRDKKGRRGRYP
ncbi:uncharacterized protein C22orf15 homolog isoform X8 [Trachypithecus francoisi]|uniref:uncharacterized protein C22orf15 homolog isoform X8 n=1 Tax=Trachypithecus francoisi TaxID=54180 RepID=UPI00141B7634|nr:uncharacterized protein C22orf15 homolog isoform X8 [Trachypithecus francoisi]